VQTLLIALGATFLQQTLVALSRALPAVLAPAIIADRGFDPAWVGIFFGISAAAALAGQLGCGSFIVRYGALRMCQVALAATAAASAVASLGTAAAFAVSAIVSGIGAAASTPASSHLLGRVSPPKQAPLVFSLKQTAVPAGLLLGGTLGPWLTGLSGWEGAMLATALVSAVYVAMMQPLRARYDDDRVPSRAIRVSDFAATVRAVLRTSELRTMCHACLAFNGVQATVTAYFVVYLTTLGYSLVAAGYLFSVAVAVAVPGRILWGWVGSGFVPPRMVLCGLAFGMAAGCLGAALFAPGWPVAAVLGVAGVISATALSWHGVLLAETARAAPDGMRGGVTGGVLSFGQFGALTAPIIFSALLAATGSYAVGFAALAVPSLFVGVALWRVRGA
jgi:hypothetical protein